MNKFYEKLTIKYPETSMSESEVVEILSQVNSYQYGAEACKELKFVPLSRAFFPEKK